jgi:hypothetical protein
MFSEIPTRATIIGGAIVLIAVVYYLLTEAIEAG